MILNNKLSHKKKVFYSIFVIVSTLLVSLIVYLTGGAKYVYPHLMYIPIVIGGFIFGVKFGIVHAVIGGILLGPIMPIDVLNSEPQLFYNWFSRLIIFVIVAVLSGLANYIYHKQKQQINKTLLIHQYSNIPNSNYLRVADYSLFAEEVLIATILIHNFQKIIDTFNQEFYLNLLNKIYLRLDATIEQEKIITSNNSDKLWFIINTTNIEEINDILHKTLKEDYIIKDIPIYFDFSMGYKTIKFGDNEITSKIFNKTDLCAKGAHKHEVEYMISDKVEDEEYNYHILSEFKNALKNNETFLEFQPKISLKTAELKMEALVRWQHPTRGLLPPIKFIPPIEETKLINDLSIWVLINVIKQIKSLEENGLYPTISMNISPKNLFNDEFIEQAMAIIDESGIDYSKIEFEITENSIMNNVDKAQIVLNKLKEHGIKIAIDDFGKGFSSLNYLRTLDVDYIKIDKSFIDEIAKDNVHQKIVEYTINLSHELGYKVVCEGVESIEQFDLLKQLSCDYIQGYYVTKPVKAINIVKWYDENKAMVNVWKS